MSATFTPPVQEGARIEVISRWTQVRLYSHVPGPIRPITVYKLVDGTYTEVPTDPQLVAVTYVGGTTYEISQAEADALTDAGYGAYISTTGEDEWFLDSTFVGLDTTEFDLDGNRI